MSCSNNNEIVAVAGLFKIAQRSFNPGNGLFGEPVGTQCAFMVLLSIFSYQGEKQMGPNLNILLVNHDVFYKTLPRQTLLISEDLP